LRQFEIVIMLHEERDRRVAPAAGAVPELARRRPVMPDHEAQLGPAAQYRHDHPPIRNLTVEHETTRSAGQRIADGVAAVVGSWPFIIVQSALLAVWMAVNAWLMVMASRPGFLHAWDPYPFILLNLVLSFQAAYTGPVVMMSQNRQNEKDRLMAQGDYEVNQTAEEEIKVIMKHLVHQDRLILDATHRIEALRQDPAVGGLATRVQEILEHLEKNDRRILGLMERIGAPLPPDAPTG
jgi:uncharacterized membrane protein